MRLLNFSKRTAKEILRDPLTLIFGLGFPSVLIILLSAIQKNIPVSLFEIDRLTPGMTVFGLSFMTLFSATLIAKDRESAFLQRLYTVPMRAVDFILGYTLPLIPMALAQCVVCYLVGLIFGLEITVSLIYALLFVIPIALFFIGLGLLLGSILTQKQVGGICGALLTNLTAWLSGIWFDLDLVGGFFKRLAAFLPFYHAVKLEQTVFSGSFEGIGKHLLSVALWAVISIVLSVIVFLKQMRK